MPKLLLVRGLPGSGKSTYAKSVVDDMGRPYVHVEADMYFVHENGDYIFDPAKLGVAHDWCQLKCAHALERGEDVVVSNTFVKRWELMPYIKMAKVLDADVEIKVMTGTYENVHGCPQEVINRMTDNWEEMSINKGEDCASL